MLLAFHQVVRDGVRQGELRHLASQAHADAIWHCKYLPDPRSQDDCLAQLAPAAPQPAGQAQALTQATAFTLAGR